MSDKKEKGEKQMIYIMTWHRGTNYGSVLQAYALQKCISDA